MSYKIIDTHSTIFCSNLIGIRIHASPPVKIITTCKAGGVSRSTKKIALLKRGRCKGSIPKTTNRKAILLSLVNYNKGATVLAQYPSLAVS